MSDESFRDATLSELTGEPPVEEVPEFKTTITPEQLAAAQAEVRNKPYSQRHPEFGKMVNCQQHGFRHRQFEFKPVKGCEQVFTYTVKDKDGKPYQQFREEIVTDENGQEGPNGEVPKKVVLTPDYRTAASVDQKPTMKQMLGAAQFAKKRFHPHFSKIKLQFIERTRVVYDSLKFAGFNLLTTVVPNQPNIEKSKLQRARIIAARQIRKERELRDRAKRRQQDMSRRINRGLRVGGSRP